MTTSSRTVLFWGAGATSSLGLRLTDQQAKFLHALAPYPGKSEPDSVHIRVRNALGEGVSNRWVDAFSDLLRILGDRYPATSHEFSTADINAQELAAMARNWKCDDEDELRNRIVELRSLYDWPALVAAINVHAVPPKPIPTTPLRQGTPASSLSTSSTFWICTTGAATGSRTETASSSHRNEYWVLAGRWGFLSSHCSMLTGTTAPERTPTCNTIITLPPRWAEGCNCRVSGSPQRPPPTTMRNTISYWEMSAS